MSRVELRVKRESLATGTAKRFDQAGQSICLVRLGDDFYAIADRCSHANFSLSEGDVDTVERTIECPKHGSGFGLQDGVPRSLPATRPVPVYEVSYEGDEVVVVLSR